MSKRGVVVIAPPRRSGLPAVLLGLLAVAAFVQARARAQPDSDAFIQQQRTLDEQLRSDFDAAVPPARRIEFDWGGWYSLFNFISDDGVESSRTFRRHDLRLWGSVSANRGAHTGYVRTRLSFEDFNSGDSFDGDDNDWVGPNLERGWYQFDLNPALRSQGGAAAPIDFRFKVGRQYTALGTGYALSQPLDAVRVTVGAADFELTGLVARSIRSFDDIDRTRPGGDGSKRNFFGVELRYLGFERHEPFAYAFWNEDRLGESPPALLQNFDYDSYYLGFGSQGELVTHLRYRTEWVIQQGRSFGDRRFLHHDDINAWGWDALLEYLRPGPMHPRLLVEYMFASGDPDRLGSPTNARGGNTQGDDTSFSAFGYRNTGLAMAPRLSNIHVWRVGASFFPFENIPILSKMEVGTDWFLYYKHHRRGAVSDPLADRRSGFLGWEMDTFANWRITSDLAWTVRYGVHFPGSAFSDRTTRTFFLTGITYSF